MKRYSILFTAIALLSMTVSARQLSPDEALARVKTAIAADGRMLMSSNSLSGAPVFTSQNDGKPTIYVFNNTNGGFAILSANDIAAPVLGYSDSGAFDPNNIPENMQWWLSQYDAEISGAVCNAPYSEESRAMAATAVERKAIAPLIQTKWTQNAPYNQECPTNTSVGCVALAMAQVMKYFNWPAKGNGTLSNYTFDWSNMPNSITTSSPATQRTAIAHLARACGISVNTIYGSASAASSYDVAFAFRAYFNYDPALYYAPRSVYNTQQWEDLIYTNLRDCGPVYYAGNNLSGGHAFVCDGYSAGYFHFNWGWGGMSDGYFLLSALDPTQQGTGGTSSGYSLDQMAVLGIKKPAGGTTTPKLYCLTPITASIVNTNYLSLKGTFANLTGNQVTITPRMKFVNTITGEEKNVAGTNVLTMNNAQATQEILIRLIALTDGTWRAYPMYSEGTTFYDLPFAATQEPYFLVTRSGSTYSVSSPSRLDNLSISNIQVPDGIYINHRGTVKFRVTNNGDSDVFTSFFPRIKNGTMVYANGIAKLATVPAHGYTDIEWNNSFTWPYENYTQTGTFTMQIAAYNDYYKQNAYTEFPQTGQVNLLADPGTATISSVSNVTIANANAVNPEEIHVSATITCSGSGILETAFRAGFWTSGETVVSNFGYSQVLSLKPGTATYDIVFRGCALNYGSTYNFQLHENANNNNWYGERRSITVMSQPSSGSNTAPAMGNLKASEWSIADAADINPSNIAATALVAATGGNFDGRLQLRIAEKGSTSTAASFYSSNFTILTGQGINIDLTGAYAAMKAGTTYTATIYAEPTAGSAYLVSDKSIEITKKYTEPTPKDSKLTAKTWTIADADDIEPTNISVSATVTAADAQYSGKLQLNISTADGTTVLQTFSSSAFTLQTGVEKRVEFNGAFPQAERGKSYRTTLYAVPAEGSAYSVSDNAVTITYKPIEPTESKVQLLEWNILGDADAIDSNNVGFTAKIRGTEGEFNGSVSVKISDANGEKEYGEISSDNFSIAKDEEQELEFSGSLNAGEPGEQCIAKIYFLNDGEYILADDNDIRFTLYKEGDTGAVDSLFDDINSDISIWSVDGRLLQRHATRESLRLLEPGIYIANRLKFVVR